ncbi:MAG TPA: glycoside hydrolase [Clostridiales bacterium]|nr:glycoside hydrolase [Clostridiales bacterium]
MERIDFLKDELWYGGTVAYGEKYPIDEKSELFFDLDCNDTSNQQNPAFYSDKGRFLWLGHGGKVAFKKGVIEITAKDYDLEKCGETLKDASVGCAMKYYKPTGTTPDKRAFTAPQYCSWTVLLWHQDQKGILDYARSIKEKGYKAGILIIDDTWQREYGVWEFNRNNFPDPDAMMKELKDMGFLVSLWICPYVSPNAPYLSPSIWEHIDEGRVVMNGKDPRFVLWWEGYSAQLDFTRPNAKKWINEQTKRLEDRYGVVGFKLDGGDPQYLGKDLENCNEQSSLWIESIDNAFKESRTCYKLGGKPIIQRLNDKAHLWETSGLSLGLSSIIPLILAQGIAGYYYGCADMIGGGRSSDFIDKSKLDDELIIRWCQASALFPMVQFSYDVWNKEENGVARCCKKAMDIREKFVPYIVSLLENASKTGIPATRYMDYEFPNEGLAGIKDQFMLGDGYLVAPVLIKGADKRTVVFPKGKWKDIEDGKIYEGGKHEVPAPIDKLPVFEKL